MLRIRLKEWLYILLLALLLGFSISGFVASLHGQNVMPLAILGLITSIYIFFLSVITTELNNRFLVRHVPEVFITPISLLLAFLSGFMGAMGGYLTNELIKITRIHIPATKAFTLSLFLGIMTASLGYLLYKLITLQRKDEESRRLLLEEHIRNLEGQISPHFMFNTLNAVAELTRQDPERAEMAIISLARLLRKSLYLEPFITLEEELELLKDYWRLVSLRFADEIELHTEIEQRLMETKIPKFSLQILVENALKHGLKLKSGRVCIIARSEGQKRLIEVEDNGVGFDELKEGIGLANLRSRLKLCGGSLSYSSQRGKTVFRIELSGG